MNDKDSINKEEKQCEYIERVSEPEINKTQSMQSIKDILSSASRNESKFSTRSANIMNELFLSKLKLKAENKQKLNDYKESLDQKIIILKEKIANSSKISSKTQPSLRILPNFLDFIKSNPTTSINLISFLTPNDLYHCIKIKEIKIIIVATLRSILYKKVKEKFLLKYSSIFYTSSFKLCFQQYKRNKKLNTRIIIGITSQLRNYDDLQSNMKSYINQTICLKYMTQHSHSKTKIVNVFAFDLHSSDMSNIYWIFKEITPFHFDDHKSAYYSNIISFNLGDTLKMSIDLFTDNGLINIKNFHWNKIIVTPLCQYDLLKESIDIFPKDPLFTLRLCEVEKLKNCWRDINHFDDYDILLKSIMANFEDKFEIEQIFFDDVGYYLFKVILKAKTAGVLENSLDIGIFLEIVEKNIPIENIIKKNNLIFDGKNELKVRVGDVVVFYLSFQKDN